MGSNRTFAYNSGVVIDKTEQVGFIAVGLDGSKNYGGGVTWWPGPDESPGYVICHTSGERTAAQGTILVPAPTIGFWRSTLKTEASFVALANTVLPGYGFTTGASAAITLGDNGYWTDYPPINNSEALTYYNKVITAGGVIGYTVAKALDELFVDLQDAGLYTKLEGFYPMLGTTAATQCINANGNTDYDLQFSGGWVFDYFGMQGNGINTYAYTGKDYINITGKELYNTHFSIYGTEPFNRGTGRGDLSVFNSAEVVSNARIALNDFNDDGIFEYTYGTSNSVFGNSGAFVVISNDGSTTYRYRNGASEGSLSDSPIIYNSQSLYLGISLYNYSFITTTNTYGWASFGEFMNADDIEKYQTIVNTFMTATGRNTY